MWLQHNGLDPQAIGTVMGLSYLAQGAGALMFTQRSMAVTPWMKRLSLTVFGILLFLYTVHGPIPLLFSCMALSFCLSPLLALHEAETQTITQRHNRSYSVVRVWGSLAFIAMSSLAGIWLRDHSIAHVHPMLLSISFLMFLCTTLLPATSVESSKAFIDQPTTITPHKSLFLLFLVGGLLQSAHVALYGFASIHWKSLGYSESWIGWFWALGVIAEVGLFFYATKVHVPYRRLIWVGIAAGMFRWTLYAFHQDHMTILLGQTLHAGSFACAHLGLMGAIKEHTTEHNRAKIQGLYSAILAVLFMIQFSWVGRIYRTQGANVYSWMAGLTFLAALLLLWSQLKSKSNHQPGTHQFGLNA